MPSVDNETSRFEVRDLIILFLTIGILFGIMLGNRPLSAPDEGRYVELSREMAATNGDITPRLNGVKYFEKPALFYRLWKRWHGPNTIYMMTDRRTYDTLRKNPELSFFTIASNHQNTLVSNRKAAP
jgi:hypothetical protein